MTTTRTVLATLAALAGLLTVVAFTTDGSSALQSMKPLLVRHADAPAMHPFQAELCVQSNSTNCDPTTSTVPVPTQTANGEAVKRLVIEFASARCLYTPDTGFVSSLVLIALAGGVDALHYFTPVPGENPTAISMTTPARIYADPGTDLDFLAGMVVNAGTCRLTISGHLVVE